MQEVVAEPAPRRLGRFTVHACEPEAASRPASDVTQVPRSKGDRQAAREAAPGATAVARSRLPEDDGAGGECDESFFASQAESSATDSGEETEHCEGADLSREAL